MAEQEFSEFVKRKAAQDQAESKKAVDWEKRKLDWLKELNWLFDGMEEHLKPYSDAGEIQVERTPMQLTEDYLGTYDVYRITFKIGRDKVIASPIGTLLIGARGRVDLSGPRKTLKIVLLAEPEVVIKTTITDSARGEEPRPLRTRGEVDEAGWYIETPPPESVVVAFSEDSFREAIMEVTGG